MAFGAPVDPLADMTNVSTDDSQSLIKENVLSSNVVSGVMVFDSIELISISRPLM
jgi:hypothetical protein